MGARQSIVCALSVTVGTDDFALRYLSEDSGHALAVGAAHVKPLGTTDVVEVHHPGTVALAAICARDVLCHAYGLAEDLYPLGIRASRLGEVITDIRFVVSTNVGTLAGAAVELLAVAPRHVAGEVV